ncbi:MAG: hypothetical protein V7638_1521 [Acidobacteriota bacterium]|jgi:hypothetical protein
MSSPTVTDFTEYSKQITEEFLQTIMVVDDRAFFTEKESSAINTEVISPGAPSFSARGVEGVEKSVDQEFTETNKSDNEVAQSSVDAAHGLNAKKLIEDFAARKIVCAVVRPKDVEVDSLGDKVYPLADSSDIVVFDWVLYGATDGGKVKELITEITRRSSQDEKRIRLIVVYTGEEDLAEIIDQLASALQAAGISDVEAKDPYTLEKGPVRITVYAKGNVPTSRENQDLSARVIPIDSIPDTLIAEFADMTFGLISNVAIAAMGALRSNTHRLLTKFHPKLDAPFLAHRAMLPEPTDANTLLAYLVGAELTAILEGADVSEKADRFEGNDIIHSWLEMKEKAGFKFNERFRPQIPNAGIADVLELIRKGVGNEQLKQELRAFANHPEKKQLTRRLADDPDSASRLDSQFAELTSIKSRYREGKPTLVAGTILLSAKERRGILTTSYWVCIQPICNCFRLKEITSFPFLPLAIISDETKKFDLILPSDNGYSRAKVDYSPSKLVMKRFAPSTDNLQRVVAHSDGRGFFFRASRGQRYYWVAELRSEHAQRIINQFATGFSRVGVDESEWLRRSG